MKRQRYKLRLDDDTCAAFVLDVGRRKTMSLTFIEGELIVRVPYGCTNKQINDFILSNSDWIKDRILLEQDRVGLPKTYSDGEKIRLIGKVFVIRFVRSETFFEPFLDDVYLNVAVCSGYSSDFSQKQIDSFIVKLAEKTINERMKKCCEFVGLYPTKLTLRFMTSRWGSCSAKGSISINYKLIQFPVECIDYVCIHELCHIKHMDHSKDFWTMVESFCPEWKKLRDQMRY